MRDTKLESASAALPLLTHAPDAVIALDAQQVIVFFNAAAQRLLSIEAALAIGQSVSDVLCPSWPWADWASLEQQYRDAGSRDAAASAWRDLELLTPAGPRTDLQVAASVEVGSEDVCTLIFLRERPQLTMLQLMKSRGRELRSHLNAVAGMLDVLQVSDLSDAQHETLRLALHGMGELSALLDSASSKTEMLAAPELPELRTIFVADGDESTTWAQQLSALGLRAHQAKSGSDLLASLQRARKEGDPYRIVLLPETMSDMDAHTVGMAVKSDLSHSDTVLAIYGRDPEFNPQTWAEAGFSAYLQRPVEPDMLKMTLVRLTDAILEGVAPAFVVADNIAQRWALAQSEGFAPRVLIIEDETISQRVTARMALSLGCKVTLADDGQRGFERFERDEFDVVLMDCQMPVQDGYRTAQLIRKAEQDVERRRTPIIALTAQALPGERERCFEAGMDAYLSKPLRLAALRTAIWRWMGRDAVHGVDTIDEGPGEELDAMRDMFGDDFAELSQLFRQDSPKRLNAMREHLQCGNLPELVRVVHALSGSAASMGATRLSDLCRTFETRLKAGSSDDAPQRLEHISAEFARIDARIEGMLSQ